MVWGVAALLNAVSDSLAARFSVCVVAGEISGFTRASSGHCYFSLKDSDDQAGLLRCAMFKRAASMLDFSPGDGALRDPRNWKYLTNPFRPSWGEPYKQVAARMRQAVSGARVVAAGHEVVCVSHQLPVEILRRSMLGHRLPHDPRKRMCDLASLNSFVFEGDDLVDWKYWEPAGE